MRKTLTELNKGEEGVIKGIHGGWGVRKRLLDMGINIGDKIKVVEAAPLGGPICVENLTSGFKVAIGRGVASKLIVETK